MNIKCANEKCGASLLKSYGSTIKLRSKSVRWDDVNGTAIVQCNICKSFNNIPLEFKLKKSDKYFVDLEKTSKEKLFISDPLCKKTDINDK